MQLSSVGTSSVVAIAEEIEVTVAVAMGVDVKGVPNRGVLVALLVKMLWSSTGVLGTDSSELITMGRLLFAFLSACLMAAAIKLLSVRGSMSVAWRTLLRPLVEGEALLGCLHFVCFLKSDLHFDL